MTTRASSCSDVSDVELFSCNPKDKALRVFESACRSSKRTATGALRSLRSRSIGRTAEKRGHLGDVWPPRPYSLRTFTQAQYLQPAASSMANQAERLARRGDQPRTRRVGPGRAATRSRLGLGATIRSRSTFTSSTSYYSLPLGLTS